MTENTLAIDVSAALVQFLPKSLTLTDGKTVSGINWANEIDDEAVDAVVYGRFRRLNMTPTGVDKSFKTKLVNESKTENIVFDADEDTYQVTERDIVAVQSLTGTRNGSAHTFVNGADFEVYTTYDYSTPNAIRWLPGGNKPDDGTSFTATYTHRLISSMQGNRSMNTYRLTIHTKDQTITGKFYPKARLGELLLEALYGYLTQHQGKSPVPGFKIHSCQPIPQSIVTASEATARHFIDLRASRHQVFERERVQRVGKLGIHTSLDS